MSATVLQGDCRELMRAMPDASVDSIVTDPPYDLTSIVKRFGKSGSAPCQHGTDGAFARAARGFMGQQWDGTGVAFDPATWAEALRVLKPGGHLLSFGGSRTYHRMACAIEDAGFEMRDQIMWLYGSGFPKSHNLDGEHDGWGTALKPAHEPIAVARKSLAGTVAANMAVYGVGALNIAGCRVPTDDDLNGGTYSGRAAAQTGNGWRMANGQRDFSQPDGRWPANVIHDGSDEVVAAFPTTTASPPIGSMGGGSARHAVFGVFAGKRHSNGYGDAGSAARFFYCAKASRSDRNEGLIDPGPQLSHGTTLRDVENTDLRGNSHPTVKPEALMRWLVRLVTPVGGLVLDPFAGSGSTGKAAVLEGMRFIGCELTPEYVPVAEARIAAAKARAVEEATAKAAGSRQGQLFGSAAA